MARRASSNRRGNRRGNGGFRYGRLFTDVLNMASTLVDSRKQTGADKIEEIAAATRTFGETFTDVPYIGDYIEAASDIMDDASVYINETPVQEMVEDLTDFARRQPAITIALATVAGLAVVQILRTEGLPFMQQDDDAPPRARRNGGRGGSREATAVEDDDTELVTPSPEA